MTKPTLRLLLGAALMAVLAACGGGASQSSGEGPLVVVTTNVIGDIVTDVVGDRGTVEVLMGPGVDPHAFSPSARQVGHLNDADLVVANGLLLEAGLTDTLRTAEDNGVNLLELAPRLDPIPFTQLDHNHDHDDDDHDHDDHDHGGDGHDHGDLDPHFYLDPLRMAEAVDLIVAALAEIAPDMAWDEGADPVRAEIEALHVEIEERLAPVPAERRQLVSNHDALGYFADRYDFEVLGTILTGGSTLSEPSAADLNELKQMMEAEDVRHIFVDTTSSTALAETVAAEFGDRLGVHALHTGSLGEPGSGADTYIGMMRTNAETIADALVE